MHTELCYQHDDFIKQELASSERVRLPQLFGPPGPRRYKYGVLLLGTWCSQRQAVVQAAGFGGDEQVAEDAEGDDEGQKNHSCHRQTHEGTETIERQQQQKTKQKECDLVGRTK